ncbi:MAG: c-type cytochrome, partial [Acidobacteria bacterium]|nr:c-type cytochrome [Acidobacteriota bacterium]
KAGKLEAGEMRELLGFLWARQFYAERGNPWRGERVFTSKQCAGCHIGGGAPKLDRGPGSYSAPKMVSVLWKHGPSMLEAMEKKGVAWPRFTTREMSDLIAYLNSNSNRAD